MRFVRRCVFALIALISAAPLAAQRDRPQLEIAVPQVASDDGPMVTAKSVLADENTRELLRNGFPTRVHFRLELWKKGRWFFDDLTGAETWNVAVHFDPTTALFTMLRQQDNNNVTESFGGFRTLTSVEEEFDRPFHSDLHPARGGRYYYNLVVDVQTLTESDLDALQQWLRGPSSPGRSNPLTAIRSGIGTLFSRILGGDKRHYEARSEVFTIP